MRLGAEMPVRFRVRTGDGKACAHVILEDLLSESLGAAQKADGEAESSSPGPRSLEFRCGDFLASSVVHPTELREASALLLQVCLPSNLHTPLCRFLGTSELAPGTRIVSFVDFVEVWPQAREAPQDFPRCNLRRIKWSAPGELWSIGEKLRLVTSWSPRDGHPFALLEVVCDEELILEDSALDVERGSHYAWEEHCNVAHHSHFGNH